jgi:hypothetical protein
VPNAPVSVEIAAPESREALRAALLDACTRTVKETECVENAPEGTTPAVVAIVSFRDPANVHLEVAVRPEQRWVTRDIHFVEGDPPEERWRAVGLVIGTLASVMTQKEAPLPAAAPPPASPTPPAPMPEEPKPVAPPPTEPARRAGWIDAGPLLGTAIDTGPPRLGGELSGHLHLAARMYGTAGAAYSQTLGRVNDVSASFLEMFAGAALDFDLGGSFSLVGRGDVYVERFAPSVSDDAAAPSSGERWLGGVRLGADAYYWGAAPLGFFIGATGKITSGSTDVRAYGQPVGTLPALGGSLRAGIAVGFY